MENEHIKTVVIGYIASSVKYPPEQIEDHQVLKKWPLAFDNYSLAFLAMSCDKYLKTIDPTKDIFVCEVRKNGLTVGGLVNLMYKRAFTQTEVKQQS